MAAANEARKSERVEDQVRCGECRKTVGKNAKGVQCEHCLLWFHCACENVSDETYKILGQEKVHFYCGRCDKAVMKLMHVLVDIQERQERLEQDVIRMKRDMDDELRKVKEELSELRKIKPLSDSDQIHVNDEEVKRLQEEIGEVRNTVENRMDKTVKHVKEDLEEALEIERRKCNLIIHGVEESDAEKDVEAVINILGEGLHLDFERHVDKVMRIGRLTPGKVRPVRLLLKKLDSKKEILSRAKQLKMNESFKRMFISPDLTRRQQEFDRDLRVQLKRIREEGENEARIKSGKIIKNMRGGEELVLYQPPRQY